MRLSSSLLSVLTGVLLISGLAQAGVFVSQQHEVYRLIDYLVTSGVIADPPDQRPFDSQRVVEMLQQARPAIASPAIIRRIDRYLAELDYSRPPTDDRFTVWRYDYRLERELITVYPLFRSQFNLLQHDIPQTRADFGLNIQGQLSPLLSFKSEIVFTTLIGNPDISKIYHFEESRATFLTGSHAFFPHSKDTRFNSSRLSLNFRNGFVAVGNDRHQWGPGRSGNLLIALDDYPLPNIALGFNIGKVRYTQIYGILDKLYPITVDQRKTFVGDQRQIAAHRLEFHLSPRLQCSISEAMVFNHQLPLSYINPLYPFAISEIDGGDADNNLAALDISFRPRKNTRLYGEWMVDDFNFNENPFAYWGNKWSLLAGWQQSDPLGLTGSWLTVEYIRLEPWVYTHRDSTNLYEYYGQSLGYNLEPNSHQVVVNYNWLMHDNWEFQAGFRMRQHGPGDRRFGVPFGYDEKKVFLGNDYETWYQIHLEISRVFFRGFRWRVRCWQESYRNRRVDNTFDQFGGDESFIGVRLSVELNY